MMSVQSNSEQVNVLVVIDTAYIVNNYPNPSTDPENPTAVDHNSQHMICASPRGIVGGQGSAALDFKAKAGDLASFNGISIYANSAAAVILYGVRYWNGDQVFNPWGPKKVTRHRAVMPGPTKPNGLPPTHQPISYASYKAKIKQAGKENFCVDIAVYTLAKDGQTQNLYGYFCWNPSITVRNDISTDTESK
jgi:hypothetical protein